MYIYPNVIRNVSESISTKTFPWRYPGVNTSESRAKYELCMYHRVNRVLWERLEKFCPSIKKKTSTIGYSL